MSRNAEVFSRLKQVRDIPPCTEIQKLQIDHRIITSKLAFPEEHLLENVKHLGNETWFEIRLEIQTNTFKEIIQKRAYTPQSLIGNVGGYLGLFIGFTLLDLFKSARTLSSRARSCVYFSSHCKRNMEVVKEV